MLTQRRIKVKVGISCFHLKVHTSNIRPIPAFEEVYLNRFIECKVNFIIPA